MQEYTNTISTKHQHLLYSKHSVEMSFWKKTITAVMEFLTRLYMCRKCCKPARKKLQKTLPFTNVWRHRIKKREKYFYCPFFCIGPHGLLNIPADVFPARAPGEESLRLSDPSLTVLRCDLLASWRATWASGWWSQTLHLHPEKNSMGLRKGE